jgi:uridine kinase
MAGTTIVPYQSFLAQLKQLPRKQATLLVAVDGQGGSGKSLFARMLKAFHPRLTVVQMDAFFLPPGQRPDAGENSLPIASDFDWQRLAAQVLKPLAQDEAGYYQRYDWNQGVLAEFHTVAVGGLVVIEGIYTLLLDLRQYYDYTVWVDCPYEVRLARGLARNGQEARDVWVSDWMPAEERYVNAYQPFKHADLLVDGSGKVPHAPQTEFVRIENPHSHQR